MFNISADIFNDFKNIIVPGMTHWQHPNFAAYFPAHASLPSVLAEMLMAGMGAQCMSWITSPAATELEEAVCAWMRDAFSLPKTFHSCIQTSATESTLIALLCAREKALHFSSNRQGLAGKPQLTVYCSQEAHSSIEKCVKVLGIGSEYCRKIPVDINLAMNVGELAKQILQDKQAGLQPIAIVAALGTTGTTASDPINEIMQLCKQHQLWCHIDAAYAGAVLLLPEYAHLSQAASAADSIVINAHKWILTNFDCSLFFIKDKQCLLETLTLTPEYLCTSVDDEVINYRDRGLQLGRRFRALKLWFVIRSYSLQGIQHMLRKHLQLAQWLRQEMQNYSTFELMAPAPFNCICFRWNPGSQYSAAMLNQLNENLLNQINKSRVVFLTHTKVNGNFTLRWVIGQIEVEKSDIERAWKAVTKMVENF